MQTRRMGAMCAMATAITTAWVSVAMASPFTPLPWQQEVKSGQLEGQLKHRNWIRDQNGNFIDDILETMDRGDQVSVIVQLSDCLGRDEIMKLLAPYGNVRQIGTLVAYAVVDGVQIGSLEQLAAIPGVAAIEADREVEAFLDTSTRSIRVRPSNTYSPETITDLLGVDGAGVTIAVMDTGVDDAVHGGFAGTFVSGFNALTATAGNPNDDNTANVSISTGANGVCASTAAGDDIQQVPVGQGFPDPNSFSFPVRAILPGANGVIDSTPAGDDSTSTISCDGMTPYLRPGPDGICNTAASGDDIQIIPVGQGGPDLPCVFPGGNGAIDSASGGDDAMVTSGNHGSHVAGIALGRGVGGGCRPADDGSAPNNCAGVAPGATLVDVKVLNSAGSGTVSGILAGLEWVWMDGNTDVLNMSLGNNAMEDGTSSLSQTIDALVANGVTVVTAAGNSGGNCLGDTAAASLAITVASADDRGTVDRDDDRFSAFSTYGPRVDFDPLDPLTGHLKPDVAAPGTGIFSTQGETAGGYQPKSGTSMAAPHVAGAAALIIELVRDAGDEIPPGAIKDVLKRSAYVTPQHANLGPSFPALSGQYNIYWGWGLIDLYQVATDLEDGITDISFTNCNAGCHPDYPSVRRCSLTSGDPSYANSVDIRIGTDPGAPVQGEPTTLTVFVENRGTASAEDVDVCTGVKELGAGLNEFYDVGCRTIDLLMPTEVESVTIPWTPSFNNHQCIQATIDYGFDTEFCNNLTQRNTSPVPAASMAVASFQLENPLNEPATILLQPRFDNPNEAFGFEIAQRQFALRPEDCRQTVEVEFFASPQAPVGARATLDLTPILTSNSHPDGIELSGVTFNAVVVAPGLDRAYSVARHSQEGDINIRLDLAGSPTSDPRRDVLEALAMFNVTVQPRDGKLDPTDVEISAINNSPIPDYTVEFMDGDQQGKELRIVFSRPLDDQDRYTFSFLKGFADTDGDPLTGDSNFDLRVLQGDANDSGAVTGTDVSYVRGRINQGVAFGATSRSDGNLTGTVTGTDISYVRARIGNAAP